eukprot:14427605-Alexandrium_andersonii.AAC.1
MGLEELDPDRLQIVFIAMHLVCATFNVLREYRRRPTLQQSLLVAEARWKKLVRDSPKVLSLSLR